MWRTEKHENYGAIVFPNFSESKKVRAKVGTAI